MTDQRCVYLVTKGFPYEAPALLAAYTSKQQAEAHRDALLAELREEYGEDPYEQVYVTRGVPLHDSAQGA